MPRLANERHESFARHYAATWDTAKAARASGYAVGTASNMLNERPEVVARIAELNEMLLKRTDITAERVILELGRVAFSDIRKIADENGRLKPIAELDDDIAAAISGIEVETRMERDGEEMDLVTGKMRPKFSSVQVTKVKKSDKVPALNTLAKHFKLVGDEGDGVNALASALADRLNTARRRVVNTQPQEIEDATIVKRIDSAADGVEQARE